MKKISCIVSFILLSCSQQTRANFSESLVMVTKNKTAFVLDGYVKNGVYVGYIKFFNTKNDHKECLFIRQSSPDTIERICLDLKKRVVEVARANVDRGKLFYKCNNREHEIICFLAKSRFDYFYKTMGVNRLERMETR